MAKKQKELDRFATVYKKDMQIKTKLMLMMAGFIIGSCVVVAAIALRLSDVEITGVMQAGLKPTAEGVQRTLYDWRSCIDGYAAITARNSELMAAVRDGNYEEINRMMADISKYTDTDFYALVDAKGNAIWTKGVAAKNVSSCKAVASALRGKQAWSYEEFSDCEYGMIAVSPFTDGGTVVGAVAFGYSFVNGLLVKQVLESYDDECTVFKEDLRVDTSLTDSSGQKMTGTKLTNTAIVAQVLKGGQQYIGKNEIGGKNYVTVYVPLKGEDGVTTGMLFVAKSLQSISEMVQVITRILIPVTAVFAAILLFFATRFVAWLMWRIKNVSGSLEDMATGDADLTKRCKLFIRDEIGWLVIHFDAFCDRLQQIISEIKDTKGDLTTYGDKLGKLVQENTNFVDAMVKGIGNVEEQLQVQGGKVTSAVDAGAAISQAVDKLRELLAAQEQGVATASSAVTQMIGNIDSVSRSVEKMAGEFDVLQGDVGAGIDREREVNKQIQKIEEQSKMLNEANEVISSIAGQTNLLAMNAAIEAAHAGEAGKGFAVVADEIRKLSENSSTQSKSIGTQLSAILGSISSVVKASAESDKVFTGVSQKIEETGDLVKQIKLAMEEQSVGSKQIGEALNDMNDATGQVRGASNDVDTAQKRITEDVDGMRQSSEAVRDSLESIKGGVKQIEEGDGSVAGIATEISGSIYRIGSQIDQFTV